MLAEMGLVLVFVYGTLKMDQPNHHWLTKTENGYARFVSEGHTIEKFPLVIGTRYNIPFLLDKPGVGNQVQGEIYEVDNKMLANLDILEEMYDRQEVDIETELGKKRCWLYILRNFPEKLLAKKHLKSYWNRTEQPYTASKYRDAEVKASEDFEY